MINAVARAWCAGSCAWSSAALCLALTTCLTLGGCCSAGPGRAGPLDPEQVAARVQARRSDERLRAFTIVPTGPFLVIGDGHPDDVRAYADQVVGWAYRLLAADYFELWPNKLIELWVFKNERSYRHHTNVVFGEIPASPYGYYEPCDGAVIVNVALGTGTLVHEMVHPLIEANLPDAPTWLNEGLASLFERPVERDGHLVGRPNWRLPPLQRALAERRAPSLREVMAMSRGTFYDDDRALNYGVARYLLYYLQEKELLRPYFHAFRQARADDPDGHRTLLSVLRATSWDAVQSEWERFVLELHDAQD